MNRAAIAAGGEVAVAARFATDSETLSRVVSRLRAGMADVDPLSRHEELELPAESMEHRTVTSLLTTGTRTGRAR